MDEGGCIINVASLAGTGAMQAIPACYTASKFAAVGLTKQLAAQYADQGIRVNALCPGSVITQMHEQSMALLAEQHGADSITVHLREDRRHIQDHDVERLANATTSRVNLEMAVTEEMLAIACETKPHFCCLVPEKRQEVTTEGGLDVAGQLDKMRFRS